MRTIYIECNMGVAGDMLMGALLELHPRKEVFIDKLNHIGLPGVEISMEKSVKCGITGTHVLVKVNGIEEGHDHGYHYDHTHNSMHDILHKIFHLRISETAKKDIICIYNIIADAESKVHGRTVEEVHFHEVGMMDALADIAGCVLLIEELEVKKVITSPIKVGFGQVKCAHGIVPVPAPATALILKGVPFQSGNIEGELCTPTGAAIVKHYTQEFGQQPLLEVEEIGYGMGTKDFAAANCVRVLLGHEKEQKEEVIEYQCNLDDMTGEEIGYATEILFENGALDVYTIPIGMKKSRPGILLGVICKKEDKLNIAKLMFKHTSTIGIREKNIERVTLQRKEVFLETPYGEVKAKDASGYGVEKRKIEYEELKAIAKETGKSLQEIKNTVEK